MKDLIRKSLEMRAYSYSPYSNYAVGAAVLTESGKIYTGCNIENAAYTPTICAERTAIFKAVSEGERKIVALAVAAGKAGEKIEKGGAPCGVCRQVMMEFAKDPKTFQIFVVTNENEYEVYTLEELLPRGFGPADIE